MSAAAFLIVLAWALRAHHQAGKSAQADVAACRAAVAYKLSGGAR